jgi:hypothetical protein
MGGRRVQPLELALLRDTRGLTTVEWLVLLSLLAIAGLAAWNGFGSVLAGRAAAGQGSMASLRMVAPTPGAAPRAPASAREAGTGQVGAGDAADRSSGDDAAEVAGGQAAVGSPRSGEPSASRGRLPVVQAGLGGGSGDDGSLLDEAVRVVGMGAGAVATAASDVLAVPRGAGAFLADLATSPGRTSRQTLDAIGYAASNPGEVLGAAAKGVAAGIERDVNAALDPSLSPWERGWARGRLVTRALESATGLRAVGHVLKPAWRAAKRRQAHGNGEYHRTVRVDGQKYRFSGSVVADRTTDEVLSLTRVTFVPDKKGSNTRSTRSRYQAREVGSAPIRRALRPLAKHARSLGYEHIELHYTRQTFGYGGNKSGRKVQFDLRKLLREERD